jgi:hypothetical protein
MGVHIDHGVYLHVMHGSHDKEQVFMSATVADFSLLWRRILFFYITQPE